ncbi:MAG: TetR/AcrR family transcriptional regulator [Sciscionella sp.]
MTEATRREGTRTDTERDIRAKARELLVSGGQDAVTLRAIARELGITAPALYRYYDSREDLIGHVCHDVCADLADELTADIATRPDATPAELLFAICRGFRQWARAHPREFALVFASPPLQTAGEAMFGSTVEPFGRVFLGMAGRVLVTHEVTMPDESRVPVQMRPELLAFREAFVGNLAEQGIELPGEPLGLGAMYFMLEFWSRLYGHVALEVFRRFPFQVGNTEPLFESMLAGLAADIGLRTP